MTTDFIPCTLRELPPHLLLPAAASAIRRNPANRPAVWALGPMPLAPEHMALLTSKYWGAGGVRLTVAFLDGPDAATAAKILAHMNAWAKSANVTFTASNSADAQVRITRQRGGGHYSYLGTDILHIPAGQATMNLDSFTANTPDSEYYRVVRHETGHTLGFVHEHPRAELVNLLDPQKTIVYFQRTQGWSAEMVMAQVLTPLDESTLTATPHADPLSIMCYQLPGSITRSGQPIPGGSDIDDNDYDLAARLYPRADRPPNPPQPPPQPPAAGAAVLTVTTTLPPGTYTVRSS